jgi:hypothetical protein
MHANKKPTTDPPQSPAPGSIIRLNPAFGDVPPAYAERFAAQRPAAEMIAQMVRRWAAEDDAARVAQARR